MLPPLKLWNRCDVCSCSTSYATAEECVYSSLEGVERAAGWRLDLVSANASMAAWGVMSWRPRTHIPLHLAFQGDRLCSRSTRMPAAGRSDARN